MNLRDLRYFAAVADTRHFGRAAERCFVSQPTLSGQIRKLEEELGVSLFERTNKSVSLTPIGQELLGHARRALEEADALAELAQVYTDPLAGPLRLGAIPTVSPYLMPLILAPMRQSHPNLRLILSEETTDTLLRRLTDHEIDAALLATPADDPALAARALFDEPFWLAHPRSHALYDKDEITQQDLDNLDLLLLADGHCLAQQVMEVCHMAARREAGPMADLRASSLETLLQLVGAGFGSTLVPALAVRGSWMADTGVVARKLDLPDTFRRISLVWRRSFPRTAALDAVARTILEHLPDTVTRLQQDADRRPRPV
ncbi:MAG: LysR substrate-binding domain-containing protein [Chromatiales bacterium]